MRPSSFSTIATGLLLLSATHSLCAESPFSFNDPQPQRYEFTARASQIDPLAKACNP